MIPRDDKNRSITKLQLQSMIILQKTMLKMSTFLWRIYKSECDWYSFTMLISRILQCQNITWHNVFVYWQLSLRRCIGLQRNKINVPIQTLLLGLYVFTNSLTFFCRVVNVLTSNSAFLIFAVLVVWFSHSRLYKMFKLLRFFTIIFAVLLIFLYFSKWY